ncbi:MAG: exported protein of unknown function [Candidatus Thorarchaeota archaeon]|nr:MAG: exported protein of unknown function [Candidatus Thorarchaeota archaeon]
MRPSRRIISTLLGILMVSMIMTPTVAATTLNDSNPVAQQFQAFEIDAFTYRIAFQLSDGTEIFLIRCSFKIMYFYQHHHPTITEHYLQSYVGFYFGKSALGRPLVSSASATNLAFYPKWVDSAGYPHDLLGDEASFSLSGQIVDGQLTGNFQLLDPLAASRYIPEFGGTFTFEGLKITLVDGVEIDLSEENIQLEIIKELNEYNPNEPDVSFDNNNITFSNTRGYTYLNIGGAAPLLLIIDLILLVSFISLAIVGIAVLILWLKGRIALPILGKLPSEPVVQ